MQGRFSADSSDVSVPSVAQFRHAACPRRTWHTTHKQSNDDDALGREPTVWAVPGLGLWDDPRQVCVAHSGRAVRDRFPGDRSIRDVCREHEIAEGLAGRVAHGVLVTGNAACD